MVSAAGGLPEVVRHEHTGLVMPMSATAGDYARAMRSLLSDGDRYVAMCGAARRRALEDLSWDRWGERLARIIEAAVHRRRPGRPGDDAFPSERRHDAAGSSEVLRAPGPRIPGKEPVHGGEGIE